MIIGYTDRQLDNRWTDRQLDGHTDRQLETRWIYRQTVK